MTDPPSLAGVLDEPGRAGPVYQRIADAISDRVADGRLAAGERLPTHRALARQLGVAIPTVSRAYRAMEQRGLIDSTVGRGTFVAGIPNLRDDADEHPGSLDLAVNGPARGEHTRLLQEALAALAGDEPGLSALLAYAGDIGGRADRQAACEWLARSGVDVTSDQVAICHGGQHAILVALGAVLRAGDVLLTEALTYPGVKSAAHLLGAQVVGVDIDDHGLIPDAVEAACANGSRPRAIYLMPSAHNPTAITLPQDRRRAVVEIARRHDLLIVEDDVFGRLVEDDARPEPLVALAPERTLHLTSLSKTLTPGLRWGAVTSPRQLTDRVGAVVRATVFNPAPLAVAVARRWMADGTGERLLEWQRAEMAARFALAERALAGSDEVRTVRTAGLHAWVELRTPWTTGELIELAGRAGVEIGPTSYFRADARPSADGFRLCLGNAPDRPSLAAGLARLVAVLERGPTWASGTRV